MLQDTKRQSGRAKREIRYETDGKDIKRRITRKKKNNTGIPDYELDGIARVFVSAIQKLFDSAEVQQEFNEWKAARQHSQPNKPTKSTRNDEAKVEDS